MESICGTPCMEPVFATKIVARCRKVPRPAIAGLRMTKEQVMCHSERSEEFAFPMLGNYLTTMLTILPGT